MQVSRERHHRQVRDVVKTMKKGVLARTDAGLNQIAIGVRNSRSLGEEDVSLSLAAPEFGPRKLYANLGRAAGQDDEDTFAVIWTPAN